ncbi:MAG: thiaminase II [Dehalococcoidia bacterium]
MRESFSLWLRQEADGVWQRIFAHPFLAELKAGTLPLAKFRYYVTQDHHYIEGFARVVATALAKAPDSPTMQALFRRVFTPVERPFHQRLLALLEMSEEQVASASLAPTNTAYINHMLAAASLGGLGEAAAALLPCPWTYHEIGQRLVEVANGIPEPIYREWATPYAEGLLAESTAAWREFLDQAAAEAGPHQRERLAEIFLTSSRYEYMFWEMAYHREAWPV